MFSQLRTCMVCYYSGITSVYLFQSSWLGGLQTWWETIPEHACQETVYIGKIVSVSL